jgi:DNA helicase-2/ATP-dependent DNA helicase PcrA
MTRVHDALEAAGWTREPPAGRGQRREQWESMDALERLSRQLHDAGADTMGSLVAQVLDRQAHDHAPPGAGVTLASLHAAKGLEWNAVFLAGMSDGLMPITLADTREQIAEERRLLYVGITRARVHLTLTYAASRTEGGSANRSPSRFLAPWWPDADDAAPRRGLRAEADPSRELTPEEEATHARLLTWRSGEAATSGKPPFAILPDVTLRAIAQARPASIQELAAVRGIGPMKLTRYGSALLRTVQTPDPPRKTPEKPGRKPGR